ncbi:histidine phosphotransferase ChpT [Sulfitobacter undariae]|uniref:Histidine phosphotransferase ChpT n=1 Tax=Sulfitobacter undariae TaxID=1563671 RepID=A0A7W6E576_9RHOB|nr:histidine phosphotransferase family protein [Sulfitobacter undariae]MBB3994434.1 histidine phosphotransferase ChpT [Sulfitobacter undariae]
MPETPNFASLIGSRICHDLISPIGAINNGLELVAMSSASTSPEMALIADSVASASARIRLFRIAFGAASDQMIGQTEVSTILDGYYSTSRVSVTWNITDSQPRNIVRLTFLALLCMETSMPFGGRIEVSEDDDQITLTGHADKYIVDDLLWSQLVNGNHPTDLSPSHVQFGLLPTFAAEDGRSVHTSTNATPVIIRF